MPPFVDSHEQPWAPVRLSVFEPTFIETALALRSPGGLAAIKVGSAMLANVVRDEIANGHAVQEITFRVCDRRKERNPRRGRGFPFKMEQKLRHRDTQF